MPETDSAVPGTQAARTAAEAMNLQMLIGGVLLVVLLVATITMVSINVSADVKDKEQIQQQVQMDQQITPIPLPSATPTPSPSAAPEIMDVECKWGQSGTIDYLETGYFGLPSGQSIDLQLTWYPNNIKANIEWSVDDESIVKIEPDESGITCHCDLIGAPDTETYLHIKINEREEQIRVMCM